MTNTTTQAAPNRYDELSFAQQLLIDNLINAAASSHHAHAAVSVVIARTTVEVHSLSSQAMTR